MATGTPGINQVFPATTDAIAELTGLMAVTASSSPVTAGSFTTHLI